MAGATFTKLARRLEKDFPELGSLDPDKFRRANASEATRMNGGCIWFYGTEGADFMGSSSAAKTLRAKRLLLVRQTSDRSPAEDAWIDIAVE